MLSEKISIYDEAETIKNIHESGYFYRVASLADQAHEPGRKENDNKQKCEIEDIDKIMY
uniref:Uncharacterized protein n=1 Tax=Arion vulgaris TaxID=1028688 RepID=A0A0B7APG2_9EUPU